MSAETENTTPRTDVSWFPHTDGGMTVQAVRADFARELERELRKWRDLALRAKDAIGEFLKNDAE